MNSYRGIYLFVLGVITIPISVFAIVHWYGWHFNRLPILGPERHTIGNFRFKDQFGEETSLKRWGDNIVVVNSFFTSCPTVCPKMMGGLAKVQALHLHHVLINSFTVDPVRDSVGKLKAYADKHGIQSGWLLLTGDKISLYKFARTDLLIDATDGDGGPGDFIHSEKLVLIDPLKQIRGFYDGTDPDDVNRLTGDIKRLKKEFNYP